MSGLSSDIVLDVLERTLQKSGINVEFSSDPGRPLFDLSALHYLAFGRSLLPDRCQCDDIFRIHVKLPRSLISDPSYDPEVIMFEVCEHDSVEMLKMLIFDKIGIHPHEQTLIYAFGNILEDLTLSPREYWNEKLIHLIHCTYRRPRERRFQSSQCYHEEEVVRTQLYTTKSSEDGGWVERKFRLDKCLLHTKWNFDFTNLTDENDTFQRGNEQYFRPCGWERKGLRVTKKFDCGNDDWLGVGKTKDVWVNAFHGTKPVYAVKIAKEGLREGGTGTKGKDFVKSTHGKAGGRGIYLTPHIEIAQKYSPRVKCWKTMEPAEYQIVFQCRIKQGSYKEVYLYGRVWIVSNPKDIRPYGICIRKIV